MRGDPQKLPLHRAFSIFIWSVVNGERVMLIQKRSSIKKTFPNLWSNACCSHPSTDDIRNDMLARLSFETGIEVNDKNCLQKLGVVTYSAICSETGWGEREVDHCYGIDFLDPCDIDNFNKDECSIVEWISQEALVSIVNEDPSSMTPWFLAILKSNPSLLEGPCEIGSTSFPNPLIN